MIILFVYLLQKHAFNKVYRPILYCKITKNNTPFLSVYTTIQLYIHVNICLGLLQAYSSIILFTKVRPIICHVTMEH